MSPNAGNCTVMIVRHGEDEDAEWQGRSPLYPAVVWDRRERRAHVTNLLGGQWQLHTNDVTSWAIGIDRTSNWTD